VSYHPLPIHHDPAEAKFALAWVIADRFARTMDRLVTPRSQTHSSWWIVPYAIPWEALRQGGFWESQGHFSQEYLDILYTAQRAHCLQEYLYENQ